MVHLHTCTLMYMHYSWDHASAHDNDDITATELRVMDAEKQPLGVFSKEEAQRMADEEGLDLVLVVPKADPPVARIIEASKLQFEEDKKKKAQRKAQLANRREVKEVKLRPNTDVADYNVVVKRALKFLGKGDSVKLTVRFSGRDFDFKNRGFELVERFGADLEATGVQEGKASMSGNRLTALFKSTVE